MAVLKDLIVHGPSRFINTAQFESLKTNKIGAEEGVFNKIVATTGDIGSLTVEDLTAGKATVLSLLDVRGELHTNQWTNSNIATINGSFYITPTIGVNSGTMTTTANSVTVKGSNFPISSLYVNGINSDNTAGTVAWTSGSKVLITGEILVNGTYMPLGTLVGVLDGDASATQIKIKSITDNRYQTAESLAEIGTQSTALPCRNVKVSLYQTSRGSTLYPLGIFMTALGENGKTFLDIYGGGYAASTATAGGFAKPVLRIGNLSGLPKVGGQNPTGYGIYTSNGYFTGTIVSTSGTIGNWSITGSSIQTGAFNTAGKMYFGNSGISLGTTFKVTSAGELTATNGTIGGITIGGTYLTTAAARKTYNATTAGLTITYDGIGAGNGTANTFKVVAATGALTASNATLTGGAIAGWTFNTTSLYKTNATPGYSADTMVISTGTKSTYNIGEGGTDEKTWMLSAGRGFGVTTAGKLYATGAVIKGKITATSGSFDSVSATNFTLTSGSIANSVTIGSTAASTVVSNASTAKSKSDCITIIDTSGIWVTPTGSKPTNTSTGAGATGTRINSGGMQVYVGGSQVASYGTDTRIGKEGGSHLTLASDSMSMSDGVKDVFNVLQKTMYIRWNRNYKGRQFANSTDRYVDSWETNTTISTWDSIAVNYKLNNTSRKKKLTSISNGVLANDEIYVHFNYSGTKITLTYGRGSSAASSDIIKLESAVVYYVTDEQLSQLHTGTYPNTTVSGALRIGNGTSDSNRRNLMLVDWSGTGKFKGDILAFCGADSSGGMSLTKAEENIDAFKYEDANGHVYIDAYRVGRIVSLLCSVRKTPSIAPGANLYQLNLTNAHLPKPLGTNTSGTGIYSNNMIIGNIYYNKTVTPNRYEFVCRNGGSTAVSTVSVGFSITYICQMDEVSGEIKYMDD